MERLQPMDTTRAQKIEVDKERIQITFGEPLSVGYGAIHADEQTPEEASKRAEAMREYFTEVDPSQPSDCIDGRHSKGLLDGSPLEVARPGVAGELV